MPERPSSPLASARRGRLLGAALAALLACRPGPAQEWDGRPAAAPGPLDGAGAKAGSAATWEVNPAGVHFPQGGPVAIEWDGETYWAFAVSFEPRTSQDALAGALQAMLDQAPLLDAEDQERIALIQESDQPAADRAAAIEALQKRINDRRGGLPAQRATLAGLRAEAALPRRIRLDATLRAGGRTLHDHSDAALRNYYERRTGLRFYTSAELAQEDLSALRTRPALVRERPSRVVDLLLVFPRVMPAGPEAEVRLQGLGNNAFPPYEPGQLLYAENLSVADPSRSGGRRRYDPALEQVVTARYRLSGGEARPRFQLQSVGPEWAWLWSARVYAGRPRETEVSRGTRTGARDLTRSRRMWYAPVWLTNDTARHQRLEVRAASLMASFAWHGIPLRARFTDGADPDEYWSRLVLRAAEDRARTGDEINEVQDLESPVLPGVDLSAYHALKARVLPSEGLERWPPPGTVLRPQTRRLSLLVARQELDNLDEILGRVSGALWMDYALGLPLDLDAGGGGDGDAGGPESPLVRAYRALLPGRPEGFRDSEWAIWRPAEPPAARVERLILAQALAELRETGEEPTADELRLYNLHRHAALAPDMVADWPALARALAQPRGGAARRVREGLSGVVAGYLERPEELDGTRRGVVLDALNRVLARPDLFGEAEFRAAMGPELRELVSRGLVEGKPGLPALSDPEWRKANRLVLDEALAGALQPCLDRAMLGHVMNLRAGQALRDRVEAGYTDLCLDAVAGGEIDSAALRDQERRGVAELRLEGVAGGEPSQVELSLPYRQFIPPLFPPYRIPASVRQQIMLLLPAARGMELD